MRDLVINVLQVEEWQTLNDTNELEKMFAKAQSAIVNGAKVLMIRKTGNKSEKFDEMDNLDDLEKYKKSVFKYLK